MGAVVAGLLFLGLGWHVYSARKVDYALRARTEKMRQEMAKLEGEWEMVSGERDGQMLPEDLVKTGRRVSKDGEATVTIGNNPFMKAKYTVDPTKKPKAIDYTVLSEGPNKGKTVLGIYEIDGDTVKFCSAAVGKERPKEFSAPAGSGQTYSVWKKVKK